MLRRIATGRRICALIAFCCALLGSVLLANLGEIRQKRQALFVNSARAGNVGMMRVFYLVGASISDPECQYNRCLNPLIAAAWNGQTEAVRFLLDNGAPVNGTLVRGQTALMVSAYHGHLETVELLLARGANANHVAEGETPLMWAKRNGHSDVVDLLRKNGAQH